MHTVQLLKVMANQLGLRERRRRQTSADIRGAAVRLAQARGWDKVTIEEICVQAGISTRTFFNYFPNKEAAIAYGPSDLPPELAAEFVARRPRPVPGGAGGTDHPGRTPSPRHATAARAGRLHA